MRDQLKWLYELDKTVAKNFLIDTLKGKRGIGFVGLMVVYSMVFYFIFGGTWGSLFVGMDVIFPVYSMGILFISTFSIMSLGMHTMLRKHEIEFLLPLPIDRDVLMKQKMLRPFLIVGAISLAFTVIMHILLSGAAGYSVSYSVIFFIGLLLTNTFILLLSAYLMAYFRKIQGLKKKLFGGVFMFIIFLCLMEFMYWGIGMGGMENNAFSQMLYFFPLNVFIGFVYLSGYMGAGLGSDLHFLISLLYFAVANVSLFYLNWNFDYEVYEDNYEFSGAQQGESLSIERPSKELWWRRYLIPETPFSYPEFEMGTGALIEKEFLTSVRGAGAFVFPYLFMMMSMFITSVFVGIGSLDIILPFVMVILMIGGSSIISNINVVEIKSFHITRTIPWDLSRLGLYSGAPRFFYSSLCYEGWLIFIWLIGGIEGAITFLVYALMVPVLFFLTTYSSQFGFLWTSLPKDFDGDDIKIGSLWGSLMFFLLSLVFTLLLHTWVSQYIQTALKFLLIAPCMLLMGIVFIKLYDREWKVLTAKKRRVSLRKFLAASVSILIIASVFGGFVYYVTSMPPDYDVKVDGDMILANETFYFDDNLYVAEGGDLTISNSTIVFNTTSGNNFGLYLDEDGTLEVSDSIFKGDHEFKVILKDEAEIRNSTFTNVWGDEYDVNEEGGIEMYHDDILIEDVEVSGGTTNGFLVDGCSPEIRDTEIHYCGDDGIEIQGGSPVIRNTSITNNSWGVVMFESSSPEFYNCQISYNDNHGIYCRDSKIELHDCRITNNEGYGIQLENGEFTEENTTLRDNTKGAIDRK